MNRQGFFPAYRLVAAVFVAVAMFAGATLAAAQSEEARPPARLVAAITPPATVTILVNFTATNGSAPFTENLVQGKDGNLYGTTLYGGASSDGTVFKVTPAGTQYVSPL